MFNTAMEDIEQTFNTPTPIAYGGTGATSVLDARTNLNAQEYIGFQRVGRQVVTSPVTSIDMIIPPTGSVFWVSYSNVRISADAFLGLRYSDDAGATFKSLPTDYRSFATGIQNGAAYNTVFNGIVPGMLLCTTASAVQMVANPISGTGIFNPGDSSTVKNLLVNSLFQSIVGPAASVLSIGSTGLFGNRANVIRFFPSSGNITSGEFVVTLAKA